MLEWAVLANRFRIGRHGMATHQEQATQEVATVEPALKDLPTREGAIVEVAVLANHFRAIRQEASMQERPPREQAVMEVTHKEQAMRQRALVELALQERATGRSSAAEGIDLWIRSTRITPMFQ